MNYTTTSLACQYITRSLVGANNHRYTLYQPLFVGPVIAGLISPKVKYDVVPIQKTKTPVL